MSKGKKFYQYSNFLDAKYLLDKKYMSSRIWKNLKSEIKSCSKNNDLHLERILEVGMGTGTLAGHLSRNRITCDEFHGIDIRSSLIDHARERRTKENIFSKVCKNPKFHNLSVYDVATPRIINKTQITKKAFNEPFDLIIAVSLAEHVNKEKMLTSLNKLLNPGGLILLSINYDGLTCFEPVSDYDEEYFIMENFNNRSIKGQVYDGNVGGDPYCGRHLWGKLVDCGYEPLILDSEDWFIVPQISKSRKYSRLEVSFLKSVINEIYDANVDENIYRKAIAGKKFGKLSEKPTRKEIEVIKSWKDRRNKQIDDGELLYICHNIGVLAKKSYSEIIITPMTF